MSSDFINAIGAQTPRLNQTSQVAPQRAVQAPPQTETGNQAATEAPAANFRPTTEARESLTESKAGEAKASEILSAWGPQNHSTVASAGSLVVTGANNTSVNQVHGSNNGVYQTPEKERGFTAATVFQQGPPQA